MRKLLSKIISKSKGENYEIDSSIPTGYLFCLAVSKFVQLLRGFFIRIHFIRKHKGKRLFVGKRVKILCKNKIACGRTVTIGDNCYINALCREGITIGNNVSIGRNSIIECTGVLRNIGEHLIIEDGVGIAANAFIAVRGKVKIGKNCIFGPNVRIHSENHIFSDVDTPIKEQGESRIGVEIGENCWIGSGVTILDGVTIGKGCVIAAGAVVNKNVEDYTVVGGVPAKIIKKYDTELKEWKSVKN